MARLTTVKKAQKPQGNCGKCGKPIEVGDPYKWIKPRSHKGARGYKRVRCAECPAWKPSETTSSAALSAIYGGQEAYDETMGDWDPSDGAQYVQDALDALGDAIEEAAEIRKESAQAIVDGFGHDTYVSEQLESEGEELEGWAEEVRNALDSIDTDPPSEDDYEPEEVEREDFPEEVDYLAEVEAAKDAAKDEHDSAVDEWADSVREAADDAYGNSPI